MANHLRAEFATDALAIAQRYRRPWTTSSTTLTTAASAL